MSGAPSSPDTPLPAGKDVTKAATRKAVGRPLAKESPGKNEKKTTTSPQNLHTEVSQAEVKKEDDLVVKVRTVAPPNYDEGVEMIADPKNAAIIPDVSAAPIASPLEMTSAQIQNSIGFEGVLDALTQELRSRDLSLDLLTAQSQVMSSAESMYATIMVQNGKEGLSTNPDEAADQLYDRAQQLLNEQARQGNAASVVNTDSSDTPPISIHTHVPSQGEMLPYPYPPKQQVPSQTRNKARSPMSVPVPLSARDSNRPTPSGRTQATHTPLQPPRAPGRIDTQTQADNLDWMREANEWVAQRYRSSTDEQRRLNARALYDRAMQEGRSPLEIVKAAESANRNEQRQPEGYARYEDPLYRRRLGVEADTAKATDPLRYANILKHSTQLAQRLRHQRVVHLSDSDLHSEVSSVNQHIQDAEDIMTNTDSTEDEIFRAERRQNYWQQYNDQLLDEQDYRDRRIHTPLHTRQWEADEAVHKSRVKLNHSIREWGMKHGTIGNELYAYLSEDLPGMFDQRLQNDPRYPEGHLTDAQLDAMQEVVVTDITGFLKTKKRIGLAWEIIKMLLQLVGVNMTGMGMDEANRSSRAA